MANANRRTFLKTTGQAGAAVALTALSRRRALGANERIRIGLVGCGGRGNSLLNELDPAHQFNAEVAAVCDVWRPARERTAARVKETFGTDPAQYARYGDLLERSDVDAVVIATPDFAHCPILRDAARAGKDAYCEKPMGSRMEDVRDAVDAVRENERIVQIGTQRRSDPRHRGGATFIQSGGLGIITQIETQYHDQNPRWLRGYDDVKKEDVDWEQYLMGQTKRPFDPRRYRCWHLYRDYTVGVSGLWGSHLMDVATWFMDDPLPLHGTGEGGIFVWKDRQHCDTFESNLVYPKGFLLRFAMRQGNSHRQPEVVFFGTKGTLNNADFVARPAGGRDPLEGAIALEPEPCEGHMANWIRCMRERTDPHATVEMGMAHSVASIITSESQFRGRRLYYDPKAREITEAAPEAS